MLVGAEGRFRGRLRETFPGWQNHGSSAFEKTGEPDLSGLLPTPRRQFCAFPVVFLRNPQDCHGRCGQQQIASLSDPEPETALQLDSRASTRTASYRWARLYQSMQSPATARAGGPALQVHREPGVAV